MTFVSSWEHKLRSAVPVLHLHNDSLPPRQPAAMCRCLIPPAVRSWTLLRVSAESLAIMLLFSEVIPCATASFFGTHQDPSQHRIGAQHHITLRPRLNSLRLCHSVDVILRPNTKEAQIPEILDL